MEGSPGETFMPPASGLPLLFIQPTVSLHASVAKFGSVFACILLNSMWWYSDWG